MIAQLDRYIDRYFIPPVEPVQPAPEEDLLWGKAPTPNPPMPRRRRRRVLALLYVVFMVLNLVNVVWLYRRNPEILDDVRVPILVLGLALAFFVLPMIVGRILMFGRNRTAPRVDALWLSKTRLAVIDHGEQRGSFAYPLSALSNSRLDYDFGSPVVVAHAPDGKLILRSVDAYALHNVLEPLLVKPVA